MIMRFLIFVLALSISACQSNMQSGLPFYTKSAPEPEWFKEKAALADAKGYPAARSVPAKPKVLTSPSKRDAQLTALEAAGEKVRNDPRAVLGNKEKIDPEQFAKKALEETVVPPLVDDEARPD